MTGTASLLARIALGVSAGTVSVVGVAYKKYLRWSNQRFDQAFVALYLTTRLGLYALVFWVLRIAPRGDIPSIYTDEARQVLAGAMPNRDFLSSYAPLHACLDATLLHLWNSPLVLILFATLVEAFVVPLWLRLARSFIAEQQLRIAAMLYLFCASSLQFVTVDGQDTVLIAALLVVAMLLLNNGKWFLSGFVVAVSALLTKFLALLFVPVFVFAAVRKVPWLLGFLMTILVGYGSSALMGSSLIDPLRYEGALETSGNLPYLVEALSGASLNPHVFDAAVLFVLLALLALLAVCFHNLGQQDRLHLLTISMAALTLTVVLFSKKSWPPYLLLALFPICLLVARSTLLMRSVLAFEVFGIIALAEHSYWATLFDFIPAPSLHRALMAGSSLAVGLMLLQIALISGYAWLLSLSLLQIRYTRSARADATRASELNPQLVN